MIVKGYEKEGLIKIDNARVYGLNESIIASGYPMQVDVENFDHGTEETINWWVGEKENKRAKHLGNATSGSGHDCYLKGIIIQFDMQVSEYIWRQWDRYHFNDYVSSQSKMHRILKLDIDDVCNKYVHADTKAILKMMINEYNDNYDNMSIEERKELFNYIVSSCPMGLMLTARVTLNYLQAKSMKIQRKHHKMEEWHCICDFFDSLPKFKELTDK
ncbi:MAG: hypothetical protein ACRDA3_00150 [Peptostreptococcaceae bacterium]